MLSTGREELDQQNQIALVLMSNLEKKLKRSSSEKRDYDFFFILRLLFNPSILLFFFTIKIYLNHSNIFVYRYLCVVFSQFLRKKLFFFWNLCRY